MMLDFFSFNSFTQGLFLLSSLALRFQLVLPFLLPCCDGLRQYFILNAEHLIDNEDYLVRDVFNRDLILAILANPDVADVDYCEEDL